MKKICIFLLLPFILHDLAAIAQIKTPLSTTSARPPRAIAYLTSWGLPSDATIKLRNSTADAYMLSFARWDKNGKISSSNNIVDKPDHASGKISQGYLSWTQIAHHSPNTQMIISFGGQEYEDIWDMMTQQGNTKIIANNIVSLLTTNFPVYQVTEHSDCIQKKCPGKPDYLLIGYTQLSGVDFDFEQSSRLSPLQNQQLASLARQVRKLVGNAKTIALTTYHVGADPIECRDSAVLKNCSFRETDRSSHHGEALNLLRSTIGVFDFYNVMTYDAGRNFDYKTSMNNYFEAVGDRSKLRLGISINQQWGQLGNFVMPLRENVARAKWQATEKYGGFFIWALGASTEARALESQISMFNLFSFATTITHHKETSAP